MGLMIDMHVHFFPPAVFRAIWRFFETQSGGLWNIKYKLYGEKHVEQLRSAGVKRFTSLVYAHKLGLADGLNQFVYKSAQKYPEIIPFGTIYAGDGDTGLAAKKIFENYHFVGIKLHPFVSKENIDDKRFFPAYEIMQAMNKILICHPGSGPVYDAKDGADRLEKVLHQFPRLKVVVAHCGAFEYGDFPRLAEKYENVYFDTAMNCVHTEVFHDNCPGPMFFEHYQDKILYGSDFPNIPYSYSEQPQAIRTMKLGSEIERKIFSENAERILLDT